MTGRAWKIDLGMYRLREIQRNVVLVVLAGVGLGVWAAGPTWRSLGLAAMEALGPLVGGILVAPLTATVFKGRPPRAISSAIVCALAEMLRLGLVTWAGLGAVEAAWMGLGTAFLTAVTSLAIFKVAYMANAVKPDGKDMRGEYPGSLLGPRRLLPAVAAICQEVACCLLVAWSPWLVLVTFAEGACEGLFPEKSTAGRWFKTVSGCSVLALALVLWLR
ncbi:hypothetical protein [Nonomuraea zeae]|uniref:Uncharacterized protein n=1 Tax=Nonomuraea zeae TaxID=1642303 RepID=A0A5S4GSU3_9ACTN|nr:hypothetical protein [Nonomuraea zeae]TMR35909.1 hypothetical protein ETD85_12595 [Nonomuraea zeae]